LSEIIKERKTHLVLPLSIVFSLLRLLLPFLLKAASGRQTCFSEIRKIMTISTFYAISLHATFQNRNQIAVKWGLISSKITCTMPFPHAFAQPFQNLNQVPLDRQRK